MNTAAVLIPDSRRVLRALMWTTAGVGVLFVGASLRSAARLADQEHHMIAMAVRLAPWFLMAAATLFGTASQFEDAVFRRRVVFGVVLALAFPSIGLIILFWWPELRLPSWSVASIWIVYWLSSFYSLLPFHGAGPWADGWLTRWLGPAGASETLLRAREREIREAASQEERNRLAQDLHDSIKQEIFAIHTSAATIETRLENDPEGARQALAQIRNSARDAMTEMEALLDRLDATPLENTGLVNAMRRQCDALALRTGANVECNIGALPDSKHLPPGAHEALFRIAQEALSNVGKHARATRVRLSLAVAERDLQLTVEDNGQGFDKKAPRSSRAGMGLANMQARSASVGGRFEFTTAPGKGMALRVGVPVFASAGLGLDQIPRWLRWTLYVVAGIPFVLVGWLFLTIPGILFHAPDFLLMVIPFILLRLGLDYVRRRRRKSSTTR